MNIIIFGASGLIGQALAEHLKSFYSVTVAGRSKEKLAKIFKNQLPIITWDELTGDKLKNYDCVINLSGENIAKRRWSQKQKDLILQSRLTTTKVLVKYCTALKHEAPRLFNASAISIYENANSDDKLSQYIIYDENSATVKHPKSFLSEVAYQWEKALKPAENAQVPVVKLRFGVVLSKKGGTLAKLLTPFKMGLGMKLGTGQQPFPWVSLHDVVRAIHFLLENENAYGPFNLVANELTTQEEFAKTMASSLHRSCFLTMPAVMVKILFGQMGEELLLSGQYVKSSALSELGFRFKYDKLSDALAMEVA